MNNTPVFLNLPKTKARANQLYFNPNEVKECPKCKCLFWTKLDLKNHTKDKHKDNYLIKYQT